MYEFFFTLYYSLFTGSWDATIQPTIKTFSTIILRNILNLVVNALGGNYSSLQDFDIGTDIVGKIYSQTQFYPAFWGFILATITMIGVFFATWKVIKYLFSIFFQGWRA